MKVPKLERDRRIREERSKGVSFRQLAKRYGMSVGGVHYVVKKSVRKRG